MNDAGESADTQRALMRRDIEDLKNDVKAMREDHSELKASMKELTDLFKGAKFVVKLFTWLGGLALAIAGLWTAWQHIWQGK